MWPDRIGSCDSSLRLQGKQEDANVSKAYLLFKWSSLESFMLYSSLAFVGSWQNLLIQDILSAAAVLWIVGRTDRGQS